MAEALTITHTVGTPGWPVAPAPRRGGARAWALGAIVGTLLGQRLRRNLALLWQLRALWRSGLAGVDARAVRLALCLDGRVALAGIAAEVRLGDARFALKFVRAGDGSDGLPAPFDGGRWLVAAVAAGSRPAFARLAAALPAVPPGTAIVIALSASESDAAPAARAGFMAQVALRIGAEPKWVTLLGAQTITATAAPATARPRPRTRPAAGDAGRAPRKARPAQKAPRSPGARSRSR